MMTLPKDFEEKRTEYYEALGQPERGQRRSWTALQPADDRGSGRPLTGPLPKLSLPRCVILEKNGGWIQLSTPLDSPTRAA